MFKAKLKEKFLNGDTDLPERVISSLKLIVKNVQHFLPANKMQIFPKKRFKFPIKPFFYHAAFCDKTFFSKSSRRLLFDESKSLYPPALQTRIRDNIETFDTEIIMDGFAKILKAKIPSSLKSFHASFLQNPPQPQQTFQIWHCGIKSLFTL